MDRPFKSEILWTLCQAALEGFPDRPGAFDFLGKHFLNGIAKAGGIEICAEDDGIGEDLFQMIANGLRLSETDARELFTEGVKHRIRGKRDGISLVIDGHQIAKPAGQRQRQRHKAVNIAAAGQVSLDGLAKTDAHLLGGVCRNALRRIRHKGIGKALVDDLINKRFRADDSGIGDHRETFHIAEAADEGGQIRVLHFIADEIISKNASVYGKGGMKRVETGGDFHPFGLVDRIPVGQVNAGLLKGRTSVGETILNDQILRALGVDKGSQIGSAGRDNGLHSLYAGLNQPGPDGA